MLQSSFKFLKVEVKEIIDRESERKNDGES